MTFDAGPCVCGDATAPYECHVHREVLEDTEPRVGARLCKCGHHESNHGCRGALGPWCYCLAYEPKAKPAVTEPGSGTAKYLDDLTYSNGFQRGAESMREQAAAVLGAMADVATLPKMKERSEFSALMHAKAGIEALPTVPEAPSRADESGPLPAILYCPKCSARHIDEGEWATRLHHKHLCAVCGFIWRVEPYCVGVPEAPSPEPVSAPLEAAAWMLDQWAISQTSTERADVIHEAARRVRAIPSPPPAEEAVAQERFIDIVREAVANLPDRTSPEDWPEAMLVTAAELRVILRDAFDRVAKDNAPERGALLACLNRVAERPCIAWMDGGRDCFNTGRTETGTACIMCEARVLVAQADAVVKK